MRHRVTIGFYPIHMKQHRLENLDALRGIAVLLMIQQHLGMWLWSEGAKPARGLWEEHTFMMAINALGMLAAPLFITLAGTGSYFLHSSREKAGRTLVLRGLLVMAFGYLLNLLAPHWFSPGTWFVLHLTGASIALSPPLHRLRAPVLIILCAAILLGAVLVQSLLDTPLLLTQARLRNTSLPGGIVRHALAEGYFPLLPWIAFFISGILAGRWISGKKTKYIVAMGTAMILVSLVLQILHARGYAFATYGYLFRAFIALPYFFPALPPLMLVLMGLAMLLIAASTRLTPRISTVLAPFGRVSLTALITHVLIFMELSRPLGFFNAFPTPVALCITLLVCALYAVAAIFWKRASYRYGFEWAMRKIAP